MISNLKGKEFEALILFRAQKLEEAAVLTLGRYGVQAVMMNDEHGVPRWQVIPSLPDFEGVIIGSGRQLIVEAKVCSQSSYPIHQAGKKHPKQFAHMLRRAEYGALCYLLLHFNSRTLKTRYDKSVTYAIPVRPDLLLWREFEASERLTLSREEAGLFGFEIPWNEYSDRAHKLTPDLSLLVPPKIALNEPRSSNEAQKINPRSRKKASRDRAYASVRSGYLESHPTCEAACCAGCRHKSSEIHHSRGRIGRLQCDTRFFVAICRPCHDWIGENGSAARKLGLLASASEFNVFPVE